MAITATKRHFAVVNNSVQSRSVTVSGPCKIVAFIGMDGTATFTAGPAFDGNAMTQIEQQTYNSTVRLAAWYYESSLAAGTYNLTWTSSAGLPTGCTVYELTGGVSGAPEASAFDTQGSGGNVVGDGNTITVTANSYLMAGIVNSAATPTLSSVSSDLTQGDYDNSVASGHGNAAKAQSASGAKDYRFTLSTNSTDKIAIAVSVAEAAGGLSIIRQPTKAISQSATMSGTGTVT